MEYGSLYDLIRFIEKGTKIHVGVLFFGRCQDIFVSLIRFSTASKAVGDNRKI